MAPETLILDTGETLRKIRRAAEVNDHASYATHGPFFVQEIAGRVVDCLRERRSASYKLHWLVQEIESARYVHPTVGFVPSEFAPLVEELGHVLLSQLDEYRVYDLQGHLPYHYWVPPYKVSPDDVMLQHTQGLRT